MINAADAPALPPGYEFTDEAKDRLALMSLARERWQRQLLKKKFAQRDEELRLAGTPFQTLRRVALGAA